MFHVFPHGVDATLLVPVLLGVLVNAAFTETFGWDFVGLVVPGYLCSVLMLQPIVAAVVLTEAVLTWAIARGLDTAASRGGLIYPVFGRDRFFLVLVVSMIVRAVIEGVAMQPALAALRPHWPLIGVYEPDLFGIGLVLVPLTANRFWKPGLRAGLFQVGVQTLVVRLLLLGLQSLTNFSVAGFELSFDRIALGFLAAPGAQIVLICTAALASHFNRRFGWDSHGILVPALLGLVVMAPVKMAATVGETALIIASVAGLARLPGLRRLNLEGPRKIVLCFVAGFLIRSLLVAGLGLAYPGYRASDLFGFGYLLPSLLAERVVARGRAAMILLTTVQTALIGIPLAGGVALALDLVAPHQPARSAPVAVESYATLAMAVAAHAHTSGVVPGAAVALRSESLSRAAERLRTGDAQARTDDGYRLVRAGGTAALIAVPADLALPAPTVVVVAPGGSAPERAAAQARRTNAALLVAADATEVAQVAGRLGRLTRPFVDPGLPPEVVVATSSQPLRALVLVPPGSAPVSSPATRSPPPPSAPEPRALQEVGTRIERHRDDLAGLAWALDVFGLHVRRTGDGAALITGAGWPRVVLRAGPSPLTVAPHGRELRADAAALFACQTLGGDCVLAGDDDDTSRDAPAMVLAMALLQARVRPLLIIRGTDDRLAGDLLVLANPAADQSSPSGSSWPSWASALDQATRGWILPARLPALEAAPFRRFPAGASQLPDAAILWLSVRARQALAGDSALGRPDLVELARTRGVPVVETDLSGWLAAGSGAPAAGAIAQAERVAQTGDPATVRRTLGGADAVILLDRARGLTGVGLEAHGRRAVVVGGDRRDERATILSSSSVTPALGRGVRTLLAAGQP